jgi:hypothetical protein
MTTPPIIYFGSSTPPEGAIVPFSAEGDATPYRGVPLDSEELTVTFPRAMWQLLHDLASDKLYEHDNPSEVYGREYASLLDVLQEDLSVLVDPEHG